MLPEEGQVFVARRNAPGMRDFYERIEDNFDDTKQQAWQLWLDMRKAEESGLPDLNEQREAFIRQEAAANKAFEILQELHTFLGYA